MTGRDLKRILTSLISQRSQGPEFIKQWSLAIVLTADEAETVREALGWVYNIGECAEHPEHLMGAEHAARKAFPLLSPDLNVETGAE